MAKRNERVWREWKALDGDEPAPVKTIARKLGMSPRDVAAIVYPPETFGEWCDCQEPPLVDDDVRRRALGEADA
jgi:hypothetical protein